VLAVVVGGSVAHGLARPDSDVDLMLVLEDGELERRPALTFGDADVADYDGGYADVKLVARSFLDEVAERGSEPARWAFEDAFVVWSCDDGIEAALAAACAYPEAGVEQRLLDFVSHAAIAAWYVGEGVKRGDPYLTQYAAWHAVLYAGRAVLAHNRRLFPFHKWFMHALERAPERPARLLDDAYALLRAPDLETAKRVAADVQDFTGLHPTISESAASFMRRTEWSWRAGGAPFEDS
jgi:Nucleotidyltransferase domain